MFDGKHSELTEKIIAAVFQVYNQLGSGFTEKVYENTLAIVLRKSGLTVDQQKPILAYYEENLVGEYFTDLLVNDLVMLELKATRHLSPEHEAQLLNYLKATHIEVGLLLNFGPKPHFIRKVYDNDRKGTLNWTQQ